MKQRGMITNSELISFFQFLNTHNINWFLSSGSCLEFIRSRQLFLRKGIIDIGIYDESKVTMQVEKQVRAKRMTQFNGEIASFSVFVNCHINIYFFMNYHNYIVEARHLEEINRYRLLCYDPPILLNGVTEVHSSFGKVKVLKESTKYCKMLYGKNYLNISSNWDEWNAPCNILWEDFIQKPKPLI